MPRSSRQRRLQQSICSHGALRHALSTLTRLAVALDGPHFCANTAASAHSTLPAAFAFHSRRLGEPYSACNLGCEFSRGTIRSRSEVSSSDARVASWGLALLNLVRGVPSSDFSRCSSETCSEERSLILHRIVCKQFIFLFISLYGTAQ
jgi:hypothetical protein